MIRFLQKDNRVVKGFFVVIIAAAIVTMVVTLVPGIFTGDAAGTQTYATVNSGFWSRIFNTGDKVTLQEVQATAQRQLQQQRLPDFLLPYMMQRAGQQQIQQAMLVQEAGRLGITVGDQDVRRTLQSGSFGQVLFPNGKYIGDQAYAQVVSSNFNLSREDFENQLKKQIAVSRLRDYIGGGVNVPDSEIRDSYKKAATKIKFQYALLNADVLRNLINPSDADLESFFKKNAARYANAVPEKRKLSYVAFNDGELPGGIPKVDASETKKYYDEHTKDFEVPEQVKVRHILIKLAPSADKKTQDEALAKAEDILKQVKTGGNFAELAKKNSDDPGSRDQGGELGFIRKGVTVPEFEKAAFALNPGEISGIVKTQFGYHILQAEEKQQEHTRPYAEVASSIEAIIGRDKVVKAETAYAQTLATEAQKSGLEKAAQDHHLQVATTDFLGKDQVVVGLPDGSKMIEAAFQAKQGGAPQSVSTGEGYAVFQVTGVEAAHAPAFADWKSHVLDDMRDQQMPELMAKKTAELAEKAHTANDLEKAAKELGAKVETTELLGRDGQVPEIGQLAQASPQLFDLDQGQISGPIDTGRAGLVARILEKQIPTPEDVEKNLADTREQILEGRKDEAFAIFVSNLQEKYNKAKLIRVNKNAPKAPDLPTS